MKRNKTIRDIYHEFRPKSGDAFIAIQAGVFVHFVYAQAEEVCKALGEPIQNEGYPIVKFHELIFRDVVRRLHSATNRPVLWLERQQNPIDNRYMGVRTVAILKVEQ